MSRTAQPKSRCQTSATPPLQGRLLALLLLLTTAGCLDRTAQDPRADWLAHHAAAIETLDFSAQGDQDLEPLRTAIGDSRLVLLGEPDHTSGAILAAKARTVRYLHEKMGFDVLVLEAGLFDMDEACREIAAGGDAEAIARASSAAIWFLPRQGRPLLDYIRKGAGSPRALVLAGIDLHAPTALTADHLPSSLEAFLTRARIPHPEWPPFADPLGRLLRSPLSGPVEGGRKDSAAFEGRLAAIRRSLQPLLTAGDLVADARFWNRVLLNVEASAKVMNLPPGPASRRSESSIREGQLADNLQWLVDERFPDQKIVVWAASLHLLRQAGEIRGSGPIQRDLARGTMGERIWTELGPRAYSIAYTGFEGIVGLKGSEREIQPAPKGSLEQLLAASGRSAAFVDLRHPAAGGDPGGGTGGDWLQGDFSSRVLGYSPLLGRWSKIFDGIFFVRRMEPLIPIPRRGPEGRPAAAP